MPSGESFHRANSASHASAVIGGNEPCSFQSVIDRPERVRRVMPPTVTMPATMPPQPSSQ